MQLEAERATELLKLVEAQRDEIVADACRGLQRAHLAHYEADGPDACSDRLCRLLDLVLESVRERSLVPVVQHAERVAWQRYEAGFTFHEVHTAFNVLEEAIWKCVVGTAPGEDVVALLSLTGSVFGAAKEALAAEYVSLASKQHMLSLNLTRLFEGIEGVD